MSTAKTHHGHYRFTVKEGVDALSIALEPSGKILPGNSSDLYTLVMKPGTGFEDVEALARALNSSVASVSLTRREPRS